MIQAQAQLLQRASILMVAGVEKKVYASCNAYCNLFTFVFGDVEVYFDDDALYDEAEVNKAIAKLDAMIDELQRKSEFAIQVIKAWRG